MIPHDEYADAAAWASHPGGPVPERYAVWGGPCDGQRDSGEHQYATVVPFHEYGGRYVRDDARRQWRWVENARRQA